MVLNQTHDGSGEHRSPEPRTGSRAGRPGYRRFILAAVLACLAAAIAAAAVSASAGSGAHRPTAGARYGAIPSWLPKARIPVNRIVRASERHPWLAIEGDTVDVTLAGGSAELTTVGPQVPAADVATVPLKTRVPCTFDVTFARGAGTIPLRASSFTIIDELGQLHHPKVTLLGGGRLPSRIGAGGPVTLSVSAVLPVGAGTLRWAPLPTKPIVSWDFDVEVD